MNLSDEVDLEDYVSRPDKISAAEISAICQEAGMQAVRKNRCAPHNTCPVCMCMCMAWRQPFLPHLLVTRVLPFES